MDYYRKTPKCIVKDNFQFVTAFPDLNFLNRENHLLSVFQCVNISFLALIFLKFVIKFILFKMSKLAKKLAKEELVMKFLRIIKL